MDHRCLFGHRIPAAFTFAIQNRLCPMCGNPTVTDHGFEAARKLAKDGGLDASAAFNAVRVLETAFTITPVGASAPAAPAPSTSTGGVPLGGGDEGVSAASVAPPAPVVAAPKDPPRPAPAPVTAPVSAAVPPAPPASIAAAATVAPASPSARGANSVSIAAATSSLDEDDDVVVEDEGTALPEASVMAAPEPSTLRVTTNPGVVPAPRPNGFAPEDEEFFKIR